MHCTVFLVKWAALSFKFVSAVQAGNTAYCMVRKLSIKLFLNMIISTIGRSCCTVYVGHYNMSRKSLYVFLLVKTII